MAQHLKDVFAGTQLAAALGAKAAVLVEAAPQARGNAVHYRHSITAYRLIFLMRTKPGLRSVLHLQSTYCIKYFPYRQLLVLQIATAALVINHRIEKPMGPIPMFKERKKDLRLPFGRVH
eukprot:1159463-Pelagomonas_calceolata.AAC.1